MDEASNTQHTADTAAPTPPPLGDIKPHLDAITAAHTQADSLIAAIQGQAETATAKSGEIEQGRVNAEKAKADIDAQLVVMREAVATLNQQAESAKATIAELTTLSATLQASNAQTKETSTQATAALESLRTLANTATESAGRIEALKTQVEQAAQVANTRSEHIEEGRKYVDAKRAEIDVILNTAQLSATNTEAQHAASRTSLDNLNALYTAAQTVKASADSNAEATAAARAAAEGHAVTTKRLAEIAEATEAKVAQYQAQLTEVQAAADAQRKIIDELLLGATNAGLASAFDKRSKTFKRPEMIWQWVFIGSLAGLLALAVYEAWAFGAASKAPEWQELARMLLHRAPFLVPLVWLAIHAARQASLAKRMEEAYAFKAAISTSFEGYRRQMAEVSKDLTPGSPLARLSTDTLANIMMPPDGIYDKHRMDPTPGTAAAEIITPIVDGVSKALTAKLPDLKG